MTTPQRIGVIVTTYNKPVELEIVLGGWMQQSDRDFSIYIADDGSTPDTADMVRAYAEKSEIPIHHSWQEDAGFRAARSRNLAIEAAADCDYLIFTDGDCIPLENMVATHRKFAEPGIFLNGGRILLSKELSAELSEYPWPIASESKWRMLIRSLKGEINKAMPLFLPLMATAPSQNLHGVRSCHLSCWREDMVKANGFDESFVGWGREDSDMAARLFHLGIRRRTIRGLPLLHIWHHEEERGALEQNDALLEECLQQQRCRAVRGLSELYGDRHEGRSHE